MEFRTNQHGSVVDLVHFISHPRISLTSHGLAYKIKISLAAIRCSHLELYVQFVDTEEYIVLRVFVFFSGKENRPPYELGYF